ncbi:MAG TPA: Gfo/Idh/MocA family oxidoreductase [Clostridia bacterium]|nr:Gfo/Idh/MocA family oxidoreductase [Clostridia bacterium]
MSLHLGFIGFGWMACYHFKYILPKVEGIFPAAAYDIDPERIKFAESLGLKPYSDLDSFLEDESLDVVLVATPNNTHKDLVIAALEHKKHVICEKPVALNCAELQAMTACAEKNGKVFSVHQNRRWDKDFCTVKKAIGDGLLGTPYFIETRVQGANGIPGGWRCEKEAGGGMLYDWGVHSIDQILSIVDSPVAEVYAQLLHVKYEVDDNVKVLLKFENGTSAFIEIDTNCFQPLPRWHVSGEEGTLLIQDWKCEGSIVAGTTQEVDWSPEALDSAAGPTRTMRPRQKDAIRTLPLPVVAPDWSEYYRNYLAVLAGTEELIVKPEQCMRVLRVLEAAFQSAEKGICVQCKI